MKSGQARPSGFDDLKIISGGQTGADRAAFDWAISHGVPHGGWCPKGRWAEDGPIASAYQVQETPSADPAQRTEWNVRDSDGTVIFSINQQLCGGSLLASEFASRYGKPCLHLSRQQRHPDPGGKLKEFILQNRIKVLNVAGSRASEEPEIVRFAQQVLRRATKERRKP
jgi:hypothetical protein